MKMDSSSEDRTAADGLNVSRREFLTASLVAGVAGAVPALASGATSTTATAGGTFLLTNVLLETGYAREGDEVIGTLTQKSAILVQDGEIVSILAPDAPAPAGVAVMDAEGMLLLPSFRDMHIHLDKTFYGGPWVPPQPRNKGIKGVIERERALLPQLLPTLEERAGKQVALLQGNGTTFARSHCNVDPIVGTKHIELLKHALDQYADTFSYEIVGFPQHGFVSADLVPTMRRAMEMGATHIGGIDPTVMDGGMEASVDAMMQIALDMNKGVDIHIHEPSDTSIPAILRIADTVVRVPSLKGRVTISHAFGMMSLSESEAADLATRMAEMEMSLASTLPFGGKVMPIPILLEKGVRVYTGTDSIIDHWSVFGTGDVLQKANLACQIYGWRDEYAISQSLKIATAGPTPLNAAGEQIWPKPGDAADMVLVPASCSAEAVARLPERKAVFHAGNLAAEA
jgi:cytosine/adenosine deaminase-related metal-dependent hydrolase